MIVSRRFARKINKERLAELAMKYANEFANKLGTQKKVVITPSELIYDPEEAKILFLPMFIVENVSEDLKKLAEIRYNGYKRKIEAKEGFIIADVGYIPVGELQKEELDLISRIVGKGQLKGLIDYLEVLVWDTDKYTSLRGFAGEIGHFVGEKVYGEKVRNGLGETIDVLSHLFEISWNVKTLSESNRKNVDIAQIETEASNKYISDIRDSVEIGDTLLFEGEDATKQKIIEKKICYTPKGAELLLGWIKEDYMKTYHFDGMKFFIELYDRENHNLDNTYKRLNMILSNPEVKSFHDALRELGFSKDEMLRYEGFFEELITDRTKKLDEQIKKFSS